MNKSDSRTMLYVGLAVVALAVAAFSISRTISSSQGHNLGNMGDLGGGKRAAMAAGSGAAASDTAAPGKGSTPGDAAHRPSPDSLSGAPPDAENMQRKDEGGNTK